MDRSLACDRGGASCAETSQALRVARSNCWAPAIDRPVDETDEAGAPHNISERHWDEIMNDPCYRNRRSREVVAASVLGISPRYNTSPLRPPSASALHNCISLDVPCAVQARSSVTCLDVGYLFRESETADDCNQPKDQFLRQAPRQLHSPNSPALILVVSHAMPLIVSSFICCVA